MAPAVDVTELACRSARLADLPAAPVLALLELVPSKPEPLAVLQIRPALTEGRVLVEIASPALMGCLELEGDCAGPVALPRAPLAVLKRRHADAERLVVDRVELGLGLRSFSRDATVALTAPEGPPLPELPLVELPENANAAAGDQLPLLLDPALLARALLVLARLGCAPVALVPLAHPVVGAALALAPGPGSDLSGSIQLARCVPREAL